MAFHTPEIRAVHFDMKAMIPTPEYALELADLSAKQNFNAILIEFEDKFPFCDAPGIISGVYTFLEKYAKCAWLAPDTEIRQKQPGRKLPQLNEKNRPSFLHREMYAGNDYMDGSMAAPE